MLYHYLNFVGDFSSEITQLINQQLELSGHDSPFGNDAQLQVCQQSIDEFKQSTTSPEVKADSQALSLILTADNIILNAADCDTDNTFYIACNQGSHADVYMPNKATDKSLSTSIKMGFEFLHNKQQIKLLNQDIQTISLERKELSNIGIALSSEKDLDQLLNKVLSEGRKLGHCEAASLYLLHNPRSDNPELIFKLTQNSEMDLDFKEMHFPLTNKSLSGYVALTGEILNIADAHHLSEELPYHFDKSFDKSTGYRTRQMLVMPMRNHKGKIIGVLQFINNKKADLVDDPTIGFELERRDLLLSLASQAAVAIDNSQLIENIQSLFEGFVAASVKAIESRDPVTSGHSFRVAEYTCGLAETLDNASSGMYKAATFSKEQLREIRYASLLHDFGKVGVKEDVLLKANKLYDSRLKYLDLKIEWQKQLVQRKYYQQLLMSKEPVLPQQWQQSESFMNMQQELVQLDDYKKVLMQANKPSLLDSEVAEELKQLHGFNLDESFPYGRSLLSQNDFLSLSVRRGSLTNEERDEIQSHVVHTQEFLLAIPWTDELARVPVIAGSHHEKLDGTGYPCGLVDQDIPVASKIMAVADIYDALTARDRPYKSAVKLEIALKILEEEANNNKLCKVMVDTFIEAKVYQKVIQE